MANWLWYVRRTSKFRRKLQLKTCKFRFSCMAVWSFWIIVIIILQVLLSATIWAREIPVRFMLNQTLKVVRWSEVVVNQSVLCLMGSLHLLFPPPPSSYSATSFRQPGKQCLENNASPLDNEHDNREGSRMIRENRKDMISSRVVRNIGLSLERLVFKFWIRNTLWANSIMRCESFVALPAAGSP